jgi:hypothetical protein
MATESQDAENAVPPPRAPDSRQARGAARATEALVQSVEAEFGLLDASEAGARLGSSPKDARDLVVSKHRSGDLLALRRAGLHRFPGFQFGADGKPWPIIRALRHLSARYGWSESDLFLWLVTPAANLGGARPVDDLLAGLRTAEDRVMSAAEVEMSTEW